MNYPYLALQPSPNPKPKARRRTKTNLSSTKSRNRNRLKASYVPVPAAVTLSLEELKRADMEHMDVVNASCEICRKNENDDKCLLCDICNKAFHTYCLGMYTIPNEEFWYCPSCEETAPHVIRARSVVVQVDAQANDGSIDPTNVITTNQINHQNVIYSPQPKPIHQKDYSSIEYVDSNNSVPQTLASKNDQHIHAAPTTPLRPKINDESYLFGIVPVLSSSSSVSAIGVDGDATDQNHVPGRFLTPTRKSSEEFNSIATLGANQFRSVSTISGSIYDPTQRSELGLPSSKSSSAEIPHGVALGQLGSSIGLSTPNRGILDHISSPYSGMPPFPAVLPASTNTSPIPTVPQFPVELGSGFVSSIKQLSKASAAMNLTELAESISSEFLSSLHSTTRNLQPPTMSQGDAAENGSELGIPRKDAISARTTTNVHTNNENEGVDKPLLSLIERVRKRERPANLKEELYHQPKKINNAKIDVKSTANDDVEFVALHRIDAFKREYPEEPAKSQDLSTNNSGLEPSALPQNSWGPFSKGWPGGLFLKLNAEQTEKLLNEVNHGNQVIDSIPEGSPKPQKELSIQKPNSEKRQSDEIEEIEVVSAVTKKPDDLPHFRWMCHVIPFAGQDAEVKQQHCDECRCYVCDDLISRCPLWNYHSRADRTPNWDEERRLFRTMFQRDLTLIKELPGLLKQLRSAALELYKKPSEYARIYEEYQGIHAFAGKYEQVLDNVDYTIIPNLDFTHGYGKLKFDAARRAASRMGASNLVGAPPNSYGIIDVHQRCVKVLQAAQTSNLNSLGPAIVNLRGEICAQTQSSSSNTKSTSRRGGSQSGGGPIMHNQSLAGFLTRTSSSDK